MNIGNVGMLSYAELGWPVLPVSRGDKKPCYPHTVHTATADKSEVLRMMREYPDCNIGVAAGERLGAFVLDVDPRNGGYQSLATLELEHGPLPCTVRQRTAGGGEHYLFKLPAADSYCADNSADDSRSISLRGKLEGSPGIDILGTGRYFLVAPSRGKDGGSYRWLESPWTTQIAQAPSWLLHLIIVVPSHQTSVDEAQARLHLSGLDTAEITDTRRRAEAWLARCPATVCGQGECHTRTFEVARKLIHGFGLGEGDSLDLLARWTSASKHTWTEKELRHKVRQAAVNTRKMPTFRG